jgi:uncharacterized protein YggE
VLGQTSSTDKSVTVTASRANSAAPDQALIAVTVSSPTDSSRDDVLAALQGSSISVANFESVYTATNYLPQGRSEDSLQWTFSLTAPLNNLKTTTAQLAALQQAIAQKKNGMSLSFSVRGTQASPQALAAQNCALTDLISDARAQAQKMAVAAGGTVGAVLAISGSSNATPPGSGLFATPTYVPLCSLTVKFALTGF